MKLNSKLLLEKKTRLILTGVSVAAGALIAIMGFLFFYPTITFHVTVAIALIVSMLIPALLVMLEERRKNQIDSMLPRFLEDLAESQEAGMTLQAAFMASANRDYGPISDELYLLSAKLSWGFDMQEAFTYFSKRIDTELTTKITTILIEAMKLGGNLKEAFTSTATFVREMLKLQEERETEIKPFVMVIYISCLVFMVIIIILYQSFFLSMASGGSQGGFMSMEMSLEGYKTVLFDLVIVEAFFSGITAGKLGGGRLVSGLKHTVPLMTIATVIFGAVFLDATPPNITDVEFAPATPTYIEPVNVEVKVKDPSPGSGIKDVYIVWTPDNWKTNRTMDMEYDMIKEFWEGQLPPQPIGVRVLFYIKAFDNSGNEAIDDFFGSYYEYSVIE